MTMTNNLWFKDRYYNLLLLSENNSNKLNDAEKSELLSYQVILANQIYYNDRNLYISLIEEYLREDAAGIDGTNLFIYEFFDLSRKSRDDSWVLDAEVLETGISRLDNFSIDSESTTFADLVETVFGECECYDENITDELFRSLIKITLSDMKECVKAYASNDSEVLKFVMTFFAVVTFLVYSFLNPNLFHLVWQ